MNSAAVRLPWRLYCSILLCALSAQTVEVEYTCSAERGCWCPLRSCLPKTPSLRAYIQELGRSCKENLPIYYLGKGILISHKCLNRVFMAV